MSHSVAISAMNSREINNASDSDCYLSRLFGCGYKCMICCFVLFCVFWRVPDVKCDSRDKKTERHGCLLTVGKDSVAYFKLVFLGLKKPLYSVILV